MGAKQTKIEGSYLPGTPALQKTSSRSTELNLISMNEELEEMDGIDPRSPSQVRTPIGTLRTICETELRATSKCVDQEKPLCALRKRFLKTFSYNLNDPRSPDANRTPIIFENDKTLNLDDTFADLFVDSRAPAGKSDFISECASSSNSNLEAIKDSTKVDAREQQEESRKASNENLCFLSEEETMPCPMTLRQSTVAIQQQFDPRSPTIGVDRTPIIFTDDSEASEDVMLENILATLSLNLSNSSNNPLGTSASPFSDEASSFKLANKPLDRVRNGKKRRVISVKNNRTLRHRVYEDLENITPKKSIDHANDSTTKRTPLSCVKNRPIPRSHLNGQQLIGTSVKSVSKESQSANSLDYVMH